MLLEKIRDDLKQALKSKNQLVTSTLRFLLSAIHYKEIETQRELKDEELIQVIAKQVKDRKESIEAFKAGKREDLVQKEQAEIEILNKYLPQQISEDELRKIIDKTIKEVGATRLGDFGKVMGGVMEKVKGRAEGEMVAEMVRQILNSKP